MYGLKILALVMFLTGCSNYVAFRKESVHNTLTRTKYKTDTLHFGFISYSAWSTYGYKQQERIEIHEDTIWTKVSNAITKLNLPVNFSDNPEYFHLTDKMREFRTGTQFRDSLMGKLPANKSWLVPYVEYTILRDKKLEAGAAIYTVFDTGHDELNILTRLHFAILRNDTLIYYSGHMHHDTLTRLRHEPFQPSLSQSVLDSLAVLSMEDYIKRLE
jgi:hypothetical protein